MDVLRHRCAGAVDVMADSGLYPFLLVRAQARVLEVVAPLIGLADDPALSEASAVERGGGDVSASAGVGVVAEPGPRREGDPPGTRELLNTRSSSSLAGR